LIFALFLVLYMGAEPLGVSSQVMFGFGKDKT
jgi:hypothetical protein